MDANSSSATNFGFDPTGLKQEQTPDFLLPTHQQSSLSGLPLVQFADFVNVTESFGQIASPKATSLMDLQRLVELSVLPFVQNKFQEIYEGTDWAEILKISFGDDVDLAEGRELLGQLAAGKGILPVQVVETEELKAQGAFGDNRIFLGNELVQRGDVKEIAQVVVEEIGHGLDRKINISDAAGDEGEIFADLVFDKPLSAMNLATLKAEDDSTLREIGGQSLAVEMSAFPIQGSIRIFYDGAPNLAQVLKEPTTAEAYVANGVWRQDFQGGVIIHSNVYGSHSVKGSILSFYQGQGAQGGALGVPLTEEIATSYGWRQDFQGGTVIHSPQYGSQLVKGSVGNYYRGLSEAQRNQLGAPYTPENSLGGGNWRQFFQGGTVEWKNNGTGEVKFTPYSIGVNGTAVNQIVLDKFNQANGWDTLGKPLNALQAYAGGLVQDFERGIIFQSAAGTFVARGAFGELYRTRFVLTGLPTGDEVVTSFGVRQNFGNKIVFSTPQFGTQILLDNVATFYRGLTDAQREQLGAPYGGESSLGGGNTRQFFKGGAIDWKANGTGELKLTAFAIGVNGNAVNQIVLDKFNQANGWDTLGKPLNALQSYAGGLVQDFEKGIIFQSAAGTFVARGAIGELYRFRFAVIGLPTGDEVTTSFGVRQNFGNKIVLSSPQFGAQILLENVAGFYNGLTEQQRTQLGAAYTGEQALGAGNSRQYFQGGTIEWKSNGTGEVKFAPYLIGVNGTAVNQVVLDKFNQANGWDTLGKPLNALQSYAGGLVQDFERGIIFQSAAGTFVARGAIGELYRFRFALTGLPTGDEVVSSFGVRQNFGNKIVFSSPQFGAQVLLDNVATFYRGLTDAQREQLGAPYSSELSLVGGGFRQFFKGGTIEWKANGTGEIKYTSYPIGFNGSNIDNAFLLKFNAADGWNVLGNPTGNVRAVTGGSIQDFERGMIVQTNAGIFALDTYVSWWYRQDPSALGLPTGDKVSIAGGFKQEFEKGIVFGNSTNQTFILKDSFATYYRSLSTTQVQELGALTSNFVYINSGTAQYFQNGAILNSPQFGLKLVNGNIGNYYAKSLAESTRYWLGVPYTDSIDLGGGNSRQFFTGGTIEWKANGTGDVRFSSYPIGSTSTSINTAFISKFNEADGWNTLGNPSSYVRSITGGSIQDFANGSIIQTGAGVFVLDTYINSTYKQEQTALGLPIGNKIATTSGFKQEFEKGIIFSNPSNQTFVLKDAFAVSYRGLTAAQSQELGVLTSNITNINGGTTQLFQNGAFINSAQFGFQVSKGNLGSYYSKGLADSTRYWIGVPYTAAIDLGGGNSRQFFTGGVIEWKANGTGEVRFISYPIGLTGNNVNNAFISKFNEVDGWTTLGNPINTVQSITGGSIQDFSNGSIIQTGSGVFVLDAYINSAYKQEQTALGLPIGNKTAITGGFKQEFEKGIVFSNPSNQTFVLKDAFAISYRGLSSTQTQELGILTSNITNINGGTVQLFQNGAFINSAQFGFQVSKSSLGSYYSKSLADSTRYWLGVPYTAAMDLGGGNLRQFFTGGTLDWKTNGTGDIRFTSYPIGSNGTSINNAFISKFNEVDGWNTLGYPSGNVRAITGGNIQDFSNGSIIQTGTGVFIVDSYINSTYKQEQTALGLPVGNKVSTTNGFKQEFEKGFIFINSYNQTFVLKDAFAVSYRGLTTVQSQELGVLTSNISNINGGTTQLFENGAFINSAQFGFQVSKGNLGSYYSKGLADSTRYWLGVPYTTSIDLGSGNLRQFFTGGAIDWKANGTGDVKFTSYPIGSTGTSINNAFILKFNEVDGWNTLGYPSSNVRSITGGNIQDFSNGSIIQTGAGVFIVDSYINSTYKQEQTALGLPTGNKISTVSGFRQEFEKGIIFINPSNQTFVLKDSFANYYRGLTAAQSQELGVLTSNIANINGGTAQVFQNGAIVNSVQNGFQLLNGSLGSYYSTGLSDSSRYWLGTPYTTSMSLGSGNLRQFFTGGAIDWKANGTGEIRYTSYPIGSTGTSINTAFISKFNEVDGWNTLGYPSSNVRSITSGNIQDFNYGTIIQTNAGVYTLDAATTGWYRQDPSALGLPIGNKVSITGGFKQEFEKGIVFTNPSNQTFILKDSFASYYRSLSSAQIQELGAVTSNFTYVNNGTAQYFQNGAILNSPQFGLRLVNGSIGNYYVTGLSESTRAALGVPYTAAISLAGGGLRQFFTGGTIDWKANGTGEIRFSSYPIGSTGSSINTDFIAKFNEVDGWTTLGNPTSNITTITGGSIQLFSTGSIVQTNAGVYVFDAATTSLYRQEQSALGLPTGNRVATSNGFKQDFEKGIIFSTSNQAFVLKDTFASYYRGLSAAQMQELGVLTSNFSYINGGTAQYFQNGTIYQTQAGTFSVRGTEFNQLYTQNVGSLGLPIGDVVSTTYGTRQDFQNGSIFKSSAGTFVVDGLIGGMYRFKYSSFGAPIGNKVATANGFRQDFQNGILISNVATSQTFALTDAIATYYKGLSAAQVQELGALVADARESSGTLIQDFQSGSIYKTSTGTFRTSGEIGKYDFERNVPGVPLGEAVITSYGSRQDFSEGTIIYSAKAGIRLIEGNLGKYYQSLTEAEKTRLGLTYNNQWSDGDKTFRFFQGGVLEVKRSGSNQVRFTNGAVGFDGTNFNDRFIDKFMGTDNFDGLGDPTSNIYNADGILRQDYQKGYITQNGSTVESLLWPANLGVLGSNKLTANGRATYSLPIAYTFTVNQQTYSSITLSSSNLGVPGLTLLNSQNQVVASDAQGRSVQSNLAPGNYTVKVTSTSVSDFTLDVQVSTAPPPVQGGGVIIISSNPSNNSGGTSGNLPSQSSTPTVQYRTETRTVEVPPQNPLPSSIQSVSYYKDPSLYRDGLDIVYKPLSGTVVGTDALNLRLDAPYTSSQLVDKAYRNQNLQFDAWARGQLIGDTDIWLHIAGSRNWVSAYYIQTNSNINDLTINNVNFKGIVNFTGDINVRSKPNTNFAPVGSYKYLSEVSFNGWATGESINGDNRWYRVAGTNNWVSGYFIFGSPENSVSLESTRSTTRTETVQIAIDIPAPSSPTNNKFSEGSVDTNTNWYASIYKWNANQGQPPADFYNGGFSNSPNALAELNLGSNNLGNGRSGIRFNAGLGTLKGYNDRLPSDAFAVRAYTQASFDGGQYRFLVGGDDGFQILAKNIVTNEWIYITPKDEWQQAYGYSKEIAYALPQGRYDLHFHYFEGGGDANFNLSWEKLGSSGGSFTVSGGIGSHYLNNEGGLNGRLGSATSGEQEIGGGKIVQHFQNGDILYGSGATSTLLTVGGVSVNYVAEFTGVVMTGVGVFLRNTPRENDRASVTRNFNETLTFDAWTTGDTLTDVRLGTPDNGWFHIKGTSYWVPSAYINGDPGRSVLGYSTTAISNSPATTPSTPIYVPDNIITTNANPEPFSLTQISSLFTNNRPDFSKYWSPRDEGIAFGSFQGPINLYKPLAQGVENFWWNYFDAQKHPTALQHMRYFLSQGVNPQPLGINVDEVLIKTDSSQRNNDLLDQYVQRITYVSNLVKEIASKYTLLKDGEYWIDPTKSELNWTYTKNGLVRSQGIDIKLNGLNGNDDFYYAIGKADFNTLMKLRVSHNASGKVEIFLDSQVLLHDYFNFDMFNEKEDEPIGKKLFRFLGSAPQEVLVGFGLANNYEQMGVSSSITTRIV
jgi:uncharacterized protein with LGFP repeats